jgi:hypothetical protein
MKSTRKLFVTLLVLCVARPVLSNGKIAVRRRLKQIAHRHRPALSKCT